MSSPPPAKASSQRSLSSRAKLALDAGEFQLAMDLYERAMVEQPEIANLYRFNLNLARKGLLLPPVLEHELPYLGKSDSNQAPVADVALAPPTLTMKSDNVTTNLPVPLVSILMASYNSAGYIEESITSALRQTWSNFELIVVDDYSTDGTWTKLQRLEKTVSNLKCIRANTKLGITFGLNWALSVARGDFVFFQNAHDISNPERVHLAMQQLMQHDVAGVLHGLPCISTFPKNAAAWNDDELMSLPFAIALPRRVFQQIGYFDYTRKFSFKEFLHRLVKFAAFSKKKILSVATELTTTDTPREDPPVGAARLENPPVIPGTYIRSEDDYDQAVAQLHEELGVERFREFFRFPVIRDLTPVTSPLSRLGNPSYPVVASLCSIPERAEMLRQVLASLAPQVDGLHIYLDRYESIPEFVRHCHVNVTVYLANEYPGLRDNGKFLGFSDLQEDCYYFTADDDILYPPDYVISMVRRIEHYDQLAVVGVHGVLLPEQADSYFSSFRKVHLFSKELEADALVNNLGTGTVAFHSRLLRELDLSHFGSSGMADLHLSVFCKQRDIPMVALSRPEGWLQELPSPNTSLYHEFRQADDEQSALIRAHQPWGYAAIKQAVEKTSMRMAKPETSERLQRLIPVLHACLK